MGWRGNDQFPLLIITASGTFTGLFVYSPAPGTGTLVASIAAAAGTDPYGNAYLDGITSYDSANPANGGAVRMGTGGITFETAATEAGPWTTNFFIQQLSPALLEIGASGGGTGISLLAALLGSFSFGQTLPLTSALTTDASGYPQLTDAGGLAANLTTRALSNVTGGTFTTAGNHTIGSSIAIPAADFEAGAQLEMNAEGLFSTGTTPSSGTFTVFIGSTSIISVTVPIVAGLSGLGWFAEPRITVLAGGNPGTVDATLKVGWHTAAGSGGSVVVHDAGSQTGGLNLATTRNVSLQFAWGTVPAGTSLTWDHAVPWSRSS